MTLEKPWLYTFIFQDSWETVLWAILQWDWAWSWYDILSRKTVLTDHLLVTLGRPQLCTFIVQVCWETELTAVLLQDKALSWYDSVSGKMVLKRSFVSVPREALSLLIHYSGVQETVIQAILWETDLHSIFLGGRASSHYDSFSGKMVLKRLFVSDSGKTLALHIHCSVLLGYRALSHSSKRESFK